MKQHNDTEQNDISLDILDLDKVDQDATIDYEEMIKTDEYLLLDEDSPGQDSDSSFTDKLFKINWHLVLLVVFILSVFIIIYKFKHWGNVIDPDSLFTEEDLTAELEIQNHDYFLPNSEAEGSPASLDGVTNIVLFGNGPFAENYGTTDCLSEIIAQTANATVYNCSVPGSYLTSTHSTFDVNVDAMDAFNFYWLTTLATLDNRIPCEAALTSAPEALPKEAQQVYDLLTTIDFSKIDVIGIMYDASDYFHKRPLYNSNNKTDIQTFYGNLKAGIELLQQEYPHIRIIVMSPAFAFAINADGELMDSDLVDPENERLSMFALMLNDCAADLGVSFVDNYYGTINIETAKDYLLDNYHLNKEGKQKLAERFVYALQYFD